MSSIDPKSKISRILSNLSDIIGNNSYPHIIIAWTTHDKLFESLKKEYIRQKKGPVFWINMDKQLAGRIIMNLAILMIS
jgi:hypothetical protein